MSLTQYIDSPLIVFHSLSCRCVTSAARRMTNLLTHSPPLIHKWSLTKRIQKNRQVGLREKEPERCCVCESEEDCSTAAVPVTALVRLNTPIQSISLHSSFVHPSIHTIKQWGRGVERETLRWREHLLLQKTQGGKERRRERVYRANEELQREKEGWEEGVLLSDCNTLSLSHWQGVCSAPSPSICLSLSHTHTHTHTHTVVVLQRHAVKSSSIIGTDSRHQLSADIIGQQWQS